MVMEFRLPDIGEGIAEGEIVKWHVKPGDTVKEDQTIVEVMTDKVTAEIPTPVSGVVKELRAKEGETIKVGSVFVVFDEAGTAASPAASQTASQPSPQATVAAETKAVTAGEVTQGEAAQPALSANGNGTATHVSAPVQVLERPAGQRVLAAPATRKLAREMGVDLQQIQGSGPRGRVTPTDIRSVKTATPQATGNVATLQRPGAAQGTATPLEERKPFAGMRKKIAEHLVKSKQTAPHFAYVEEVDMTELVRLREQLLPVAAQEYEKGEQVKLSYLPFIIKAVIAGLRQFPALNATLDEDKQEIVFKHYYNMGVAVATDQGLIVPVIKNGEAKNILTLAKEIQDLATRARANKLQLEELRGGTFTLTSIGSIGGLFSVPIINYPEVAIMGINKITQRPVVRNGEIVIREMMYLSISCDHRVVDGSEAALFVKRVIEFLENPGRLLLEG